MQSVSCHVIVPLRKGVVWNLSANESSLPRMDFKYQCVGGRLI